MMQLYIRIFKLSNPELFLLNGSGYGTAQTQLYKGCVHYNVKLTKKKSNFLSQLDVYLSPSGS